MLQSCTLYAHYSPAYDKRAINVALPTLKEKNVESEHNLGSNEVSIKTYLGTQISII